MKSEFPPAMLQPQAFEHDACWFSIAGAPVPAGLAEICDIVAEVPESMSAPFICFAAVDGHSLASVVRTCRARLGDEAHLVLVFPGRELQPSAVRAVDFGADDVAAADDRQSLILAFARAERVTQARRRSAAVNRARDVEHDYLKACIDKLPTPIFFKNDHGVYVRCNQAYLDYTGLSEEAVIGRTAYDVASDEDARRYEAIDRELMEQGGSLVYEVSVRHSDGTLRDVLCQSAVITDAAGIRRGIAGAMLDISERKRLEAQLADAAARDPLTNIYNRRKFFSLANEALAESLVDRRPVSLVVIDVDHFKAVNDRHGHAAGDRVLCDVAALLQASIGSGNIVARAGGEEFFAMLPGHDVEAASELMETLRRGIADLRINDGTRSLNVTVSVGVAQLALGDEDVWACLRRADRALYEAKNGGRNRISLAA